MTAPAERHPEDSGDEGVIAAVASTVAVLEGLADAYAAASIMRGLQAAADSRAMAELAAEHRYRFGPWQEPVADAHSMAGLLVYAGVDHLRSYAHLFASPPVPVYTHLVVARASLEAFGWGRWLADPGIAVEVRVKRNRVHQLDDAKQRRRFDDPEMRAKATEVRDRVNAGADAAGWRVVNNPKPGQRPSVGGESLPWPADVIAAVAGPPGVIVEELGKDLWCLLSGITHSVRYALLTSLGPPLPPESPLDSVLRAPLWTTARTAHLIGVVVGRAAENACGAYLALLGWDDAAEWRGAVERFERHAAAVIEATR